MTNVTVVGLGYIGLPTALMMASHGVNVTGVDVNPSTVQKLNNGELTFKEDGLSELFAEAQKSGIKFTTQMPVGTMYIVAVPTPFDKVTKKIDLDYVTKAVQDVLEVCEENAIIVIESTISPGTVDGFVRPAVAEKGKKVHLVHAPERIIPGSMVRELLNNARTIGADERTAAEKVKEVYSTFCKAEIVLTDIRAAEMSKVAENTFRDINIAYANELLKICREGGIDPYEVIKIANMHPRVNILSPGPGVGGHCISVDPWFLVGDYPQLSLLIHEARKINDGMPLYVLERLQPIMEKHKTPADRVGFYGLTYKEDVDDIRKSPTLQIFEHIHTHLGNYPKCYDPMVNGKMFNSQYDNFDDFLADADLVVIMVAHSHIKQNSGKLKGKIVFDTRNVLTPGIYAL
jgi:UDP-N-acetyl-D-mannosaminuronic acid dehydrogenase